MKAQNSRNIKLNKIVLLTAALSGITSVKASMEDFYCPCFYIGADAQIRSMKFQEGFGSNVCKRDYPQGNFYLGIKGNEYIGIEGGFETSRSQTRSVFLPMGASLFGIPQPFDVQQNVVVRFQGIHTSLIGFFPVWEDKRFNLIVAAGVANLKIQIENTTTQVANIPFTRSITLSQSKNVLRLMTGAQFMFNTCFGVRANVRWENTSQFKTIAPINSLFGSRSMAKAKNSFVYGLGFFIQY